MNVLFTHSYFYKFDPKQWRFKQPYPPLATIQAAAVVRKAAFNVSLFDTNLLDDTTAFESAMQKFNADVVVIYDDGFNYLTKMCLTNMREAAFDMARVAKKSGCTVIVCSSDSTDHYEKYLEHCDIVIRGEGEATLTELLHALQYRTSVQDIRGIAFKKEKEIVVTAARPVITALDDLPLPAWDLIDVEQYRQVWVKHHGYFSLNIATTRGCPFKCNWCAKPIYGNRYTSRSPEHVIGEIEYLMTTYRPDHFWMCDDIFGLKPGWVQRFNALTKERKLSIRYKIQSRADLLLQEDTIQALAQSGVETIWVGAESGAQKILDAMDKGTTVEQIYNATKLLKQHHVRVAFFLQFGYPGETKTEIDQTIRMVLDLMPDEVGISVSYPLPGTKFFQKVQDQLKEKRNWSDSDDLAMMFESTYKTTYYRQLHRYVHSIYRKHKGYGVLKKLLTDPLRLTFKDLRAGVATFYYLPLSVAQQIKLRKLETV